MITITKTLAQKKRIRLQILLAVTVFAATGIFLLIRSFAAPVPGDLNGNGAINNQDLSLLLSNWKKRTSTGDFDGNGVVNARDLSIFMGYWRKSGTPAPTPSPATPPATAATTTPASNPTPTPAPTPVARTIKVMPIGSSTVQGEYSSNGAGFRYPLYKTMTTVDKKTVDFVGSQFNGPNDYDRNHEGHSGWMIGSNGPLDLNTYITNWMNTYKPDIVIFYAGTNDLGNNASAADTAARFDLISSKIFAAAPATKFIVGSLFHPIDNSSVAAKARDFNARLKPIADKYRSQGRSMQIVDLDSIITNADHANGLHLNDNGYNKVAAAFLNAVRTTYTSF